MKERRVTETSLKDVMACAIGLKWFNKQYPKGFRITKANLEDFIDRADKLTDSFSYSGLGKGFKFRNTVHKRNHTMTCLAFVLEAAFGNSHHTCKMDIADADEKTTKKVLLEMVWGDVKIERSLV